MAKWQQSRPVIQQPKWMQSPAVKPVSGMGGIRSVPISEEEIERNRLAEKNQLLDKMIRSGQIEPVDDTFVGNLKADIPQMTGGTIGGMAGAKLGAQAGMKMPGHPLLKGLAVAGGATAGAFLGGMGGKGYQQAYRMVGRNKSMPLGEIYNEQVIAGIEEGASELIGRGIAGGVGKLLAPVSKRVLPGARGLNRELLKRGAHLTPAQMTESRLIDTLEGMAEKSFFGGGKLQRLKTIGQPQAFGRYVDDIVEQIAKGTKTQMSPEDVGSLLLDTIEGKRTVFKATAKAAYSKVDKLAKGVKVPLTELKSFAQKAMKDAATRKGIGSTASGDALLKKVLQLDDSMTFRQAQALRSALLDERSAMAITKDKALGIASQFIKHTDQAIEKGSKEFSPEALNAWRIANKFYRKGQEGFNKKIVRLLTKSLAENPEVAVRKIFRPGASKQIKVVKQAIDPLTWNTLKTSYLETLIKESSNSDGMVLGKSFLSRLNKMGDDTLKTIFNGQEIASIRSIGKLGEILQKPTGGSGGMVIQLMQAGAAMQLLSGQLPNLVGESTTVLLGPSVVSRMIANPKWSKLLSTGMKMPRGSPEAAAVMARLLRAKLQIEKEMKRKKVPNATLQGLSGFGGRGF